jgi:5-methylcytosine-specific restriction endonuclease McrA
MVESAIRQEEQAEKIQISKEEKLELFEQIKSKNMFETTKTLKKELPSFKPPKPRAVPGEDNQLQVTLQFDEKDWEKIKDLMAHFSHSVPDQKLESLLLYWHKQVEAKKQKQKERVEKQARQQTQSKAKTESSSKNLSSSEKFPLKQRWTAVKREYIPQRIKVLLRNRSNEQCEFRAANGRRCESKHFLEIDHIFPLALGGSNEFKNLRMCCRAHNQLSAKNWGLFRPE